MQIMRSAVGGINTRDNDIDRGDGNSSEALNVIKDVNGNVVTRDGIKTDFTGTINQICDKTSYQGQTFRLDRNGDTFIGDDNTYTQIPRGYQVFTVFDTTLYGLGSSFAEANKNLYFTNPDGATRMPLMKYDGQMTYRAGVPIPVTSGDSVGGSGTAATAYWRVWMGAKDANGLITYGDYVTFSGSSGETTSTLSLDIATLNGTLFSDKYILIDGTFNIGRFVAVDIDTVTTDDHNLIVGDWILMNVFAKDVPPYPKTSIWLQVTAATVTTVTFDINPIKDSDIFGDDLDNRYASINDNEIFSNVSIFAAVSLEEFSEYEMIGNTLTTEYSDNFSLYGISWLSGNAAGGSISLTKTWANTSIGIMEDIYDPTVLKGLPPSFKFVTIFNNTMVGYSSPFGTDIDNSDGSLPNTTPEGYNRSIHYSGLGNGSDVETFPPFNSTPIGRTDEGDPSGIFANQDYLLVFKDRRIYTISGSLATGNFRVQDIQTSGVGCVSHRSLVQIDNGCAFVSARGVHVIAGSSKPVEMSEVIQDQIASTNLPDGLDLSKAVASIDFATERYFLYVPWLNLDGVTYDYEFKSKVFVYDYFRKEWWIWSGINAKGGFSVLVDQYNNYRTKFSDGVNILEFDPLIQNDNGVAIDDYYWTNWENLGEPSIDKRWSDIKVYSLLPTTWKMKISAQSNWDKSILTMPESSKIVNSTDHYKKQGVDRSKAFSMRFKIANGVLDQKMCISAIEYEVEPISGRMKS